MSKYDASSPRSVTATGRTRSRVWTIRLSDEGEVHVLFDDSIISDTAAVKAQDMAEVGVTMHAWEYRMKWYGEDAKAAKARAQALNKNAAS